MSNVHGVQTNSTDYNYFNALPGTSPGATAGGTVPSIAVITPAAGTSSPFRADNGISPMEAGMFDINPAFDPKRQSYLQSEQQGGTPNINQPSILQEAQVGPGDADNPAAIENAGDTGPNVRPTPFG